MPETTILTHADPDGICAGAVALSAFPGARVFFTKPTSFLSDLLHSDSRRVVITDIALTKQDAPRIVKLFGRMKSGGSTVLYFDHHIIPETTSMSAVKGSLSFYSHSRSASASIRSPTDGCSTSQRRISAR